MLGNMHALKTSECMHYIPRAVMNTFKIFIFRYTRFSVAKQFKNYV